MKKLLTLHKMCVTSLLCDPWADLWPFYRFEMRRRSEQQAATVWNNLISKFCSGLQENPNNLDCQNPKKVCLKGMKPNLIMSRFAGFHTTSSKFKTKELFYFYEVLEQLSSKGLFDF